MTKNTTLNLRVDSLVKEQAEEILNQLGIPMSTAINMYLRKIYLTKGIPFTMELPQFPYEVNADAMSTLELHEKLNKGYEDYLLGNVKEASVVFDEIKKKYSL